MHSEDMFDCPVCMEKMKPPKRIFQCSNGHSFCGQCKNNPSMTSCPICRIQFTGSNVSRNIMAETLVSQMISSPSTSVPPSEDTSPSAPPKENPSGQMQSIHGDFVDSRREMGYILKPERDSDDTFQLEKNLVNLLQKLDLDHLWPVFADNEVTMRDLQKLQSSDLKDIGIKRLMDRKRILEAAKDQQSAGTQRDANIVKSVIQTVQEVIFNYKTRIKSDMS